MQTLLTRGTPYVQDELVRVEALLAERLRSDVPIVSDLGRYVVESGGKRFRPSGATWSRAGGSASGLPW